MKVFAAQLFFLVFILITCPIPGSGQALAPDTAAQQLRSLPQEKITEIAEREAFRYEVPAREPQSSWDKFKAWLYKQLSTLFGTPAAQAVWEVLLYLAFAALFLLILNQYLKGNIRRILLGHTTPAPTSAVTQAVGTDTGFEERIQSAVAGGNYGQAIRFLYRQSLHQLQQSGHIDWRRDKTNHDYLYEIGPHELQRLFREVTRYYEYAEYGNFSVSRAEFENARNRFQQLKTLI